MGLDTIAKRMRWSRERSGMTQEELARKAGTTKDVIAQVEVGRTKRPRQAEQIADALGVPVAWLMFGDSELEPDAVEVAVAYQGLPEHVKLAIRALIDSSK